VWAGDASKRFVDSRVDAGGARRLMAPRIAAGSSLGSIRMAVVRIAFGRRFVDRHVDAGERGG
jgi:hypothetical protein